MEIAQSISDNKQPQKEHKQFMLFHNVHFGAIYASPDLTLSNVCPLADELCLDYVKKFVQAMETFEFLSPHKL